MAHPLHHPRLFQHDGSCRWPASPRRAISQWSGGEAGKWRRATHLIAVAGCTFFECLRPAAIWPEASSHSLKELALLCINVAAPPEAPTRKQRPAAQNMAAELHQAWSG